MTDDLLDAVRELPKVCTYLHVPAQYGDDELLKRMKRMYTVEYYRDMLARCREKVPGVAVSSDFIVGFCGETEEQFQQDLRPGAGERLQEQLHLQVQHAAGHQGRRPVPRRRARGGEEAPQQRPAGDPERGEPRRPPPARSARRSRCWWRGRASRRSKHHDGGPVGAADGPDA